MAGATSVEKAEPQEFNESGTPQIAKVGLKLGPGLQNGAAATRAPARG